MRLQHQPNKLTCGQTAVAIASGVPVRKAIAIFGHDHDTRTYEVKIALKKLGLKCDTRRRRVSKLRSLPPFCLIFLRSNLVRWGHWAVHYEGKILDPWYGRIDAKKMNYPYKDIYISSYLEIYN